MRGKFANELELVQNKQHNTGILISLNSRSSKVRLNQFLVCFQLTQTRYQSAQQLISTESQKGRKLVINEYGNKSK